MHIYATSFTERVNCSHYHGTFLFSLLHFSHWCGYCYLAEVSQRKYYLYTNNMYLCMQIKNPAIMNNFHFNYWTFNFPTILTGCALLVQSAESYDNYAQYGYNSKIDGGAKNYFGAARRNGLSGEWLYRLGLPHSLCTCIRKSTILNIQYTDIKKQ